MKLLTHAYSWTAGDPDTRKTWMREFAEAGETHIVLTNKLLSEACGEPIYLMNFYKEMRNFGLDFVDGHALWGPWSDPGMPLEEWHEQLILRHRATLRFCSRFGVDTLAFHTGVTSKGLFGKELPLDDYRKSLIRSMEELLPHAERYGVILTLENQWTPLNQSRILLEVMEYFHSPFLGLCYDSGHGNLTEKGGKSPEKSCVPPVWNDFGIPIVWEENLIEKFVPWMVNCHLHDNDGMADEHQLPGNGTVDWARIKKALHAAPRLKNIQNESAPHGHTIRETCRIYRELLKDL